MSGAAARLRRHGPELLLLAAFALTRLVARIAFGLRFEGDVRHYWHVLDYPLLQDDLLRSILYLHDQPPLYNLGLGIVLKWVPASFASPVFEAAFLVLGYLGIVGIYALLVELGTPRGAALAAALLQTLSTTWLVYESWLFYTLPTAALMTWAAVWLARAARGSAAAATAFAAAVAGLSWIRATYQPVWVAAALALLLVAVRGSASGARVSARRAALAALVLAMALPAKNWLLVGSFASSTWLGMNLAHMTTERLDEATREQWIAAGELHPVARVRAFAPLADYPEELRAPLASAPAHPALTAPLKSEGSPNLNHSAYVGIARAYQGASLVVVRKRPDVYLERVRRALVTWLRPPTDYIEVVPLREAVAGWDRLHTRLLLWSSLERRRAGPTLVLLPAVVLFVAALRLRSPAERRRLGLLLAFPLLAIGWNASVGNLVDVEENNRFRVEVEGLIVALGCWALIECVRLARGAYRRASSGAPDDSPRRAVRARIPPGPRELPGPGRDRSRLPARPRRLRPAPRAASARGERTGRARRKRPTGGGRPGAGRRTRTPAGRAAAGCRDSAGSAAPRERRSRRECLRLSPARARRAEPEPSTLRRARGRRAARSRSRRGSRRP